MKMLSATAAITPQQEAKPGLRENWRQFAWLVVINAFVGGMVGLERTIFPQYAEAEFGITSHTAILSFITAFGFSKVVANYYTGKLANIVGRKKLLLAGWAIAIPIPFMLLYAPHWNWVVFANILLGISQGLTWSSTVVMKIDLVGEENRGLAMGLNEFAGYLSVGVVAFATGYVASNYGVTPYPFYIGIAIAIAGFILTAVLVKDTRSFATNSPAGDCMEKAKNIFIETTIRNPTLSAVTQAGLINNLNDGMIWGLLPVWLLSLGYKPTEMGMVTAIYPAVWGLGQLATGKMADHYSRKGMLFWGMLLQGLAIIFIPYSHQFYLLITLAVVLGLGTALVYPTFLVTLAHATCSRQRAEAIGIFRLWRDLGYAVGAIVSGVVADWFGIQYAILLIGGITLASAVVIQVRMPGAGKRWQHKKEHLHG